METQVWVSIIFQRTELLVILVAAAAIAVISLLISRLIRLAILLFVLVSAAEAGVVAAISIAEIVILRWTEAVSGLAIIGTIIHAVLIAILTG